MLFHVTRSLDSLRRALQAAVAKHRPASLRHLLAGHGETAFADALAVCSERVVADALSMLSTPERASVSRRLNKDTRTRLCRAGGISPTADRSPLDGFCRMATDGPLVRRHPA